MVGSIGNLYGSVHELDGSYMCRDDGKAALLTPAGGKLLELVPAAGFVQGVLTYTCLGILRASLRSKKVLTDVFLGKKNKKRKAKDAFRHEAATRVVRRRGAWAGPWRPWHVSSRPCAACCSRRASSTACERVFRHRAGIVPGWRK
ncbi:hypothetical protein ACQ4PT_003752 [Festuca glaucescens]